jgi:hypothetical protein
LDREREGKAIALCEFLSRGPPNTARSASDDGDATGVDDGMQFVVDGHRVWPIRRRPAERRRPTTSR